MQKKLKKRICNSLIVLFMSVFAFLFLYPLFFMLINSLKNKTQYYSNSFALPEALNLSNYFMLFKQFGILRYLGNTLLIAVSSILLTLVYAVLASYAYTKMSFRGKNVSYLFIICTMFFPAQVTMIPLYVMFAKINLINTYTGIILVSSAAMLPSTIMLLRSNFAGIDKSIFEAARIDGAGYFDIIWNILLPVGKPVIAVSSIFNFLYVCNDLFRPMILLQTPEKRTLTVALSSLTSQRNGDPTYLFAGLFLSALLPLAVYLIFSKSIVKGITMGSIK